MRPVNVAFLPSNHVRVANKAAEIGEKVIYF